YLFIPFTSSWTYGAASVVQRKDVPIRYFIRETGKMQEVEAGFPKKIAAGGRRNARRKDAEAPSGGPPRQSGLQRHLLDMRAHVRGVEGEHLAVGRFRPRPVAQ